MLWTLSLSELFVHSLFVFVELPFNGEYRVIKNKVSSQRLRCCTARDMLSRS